MRVSPTSWLALLWVLALATSCRRVETGGGSAGVEPVPIETASGVAAILVPGGVFRMGSDRGRPDEAPVREVTVSAFVMDRFEVTQDEYARLQLPDPSNFKGAGHPIEQVRWSDAALFCNRRSEAEGLQPCYDEDTFACDFEASGYRLPTEAEWEYACRAGGQDDPPLSVAGATGLDARACYAANSGKRTAPVGQRRPNAWGFHDLLGNVAEWCHDVYSETAYAGGAAVDPRGPAEGPKRVLRGGSWSTPAADCRPTRRFQGEPGIADACFARNTYGFRCVRRPSAEELARLADDGLPQEAAR